MTFHSEEQFTPVYEYEAPAIVYDGLISTRAGSPLGGGSDNNADGVDPADLFD